MTIVCSAYALLFTYAATSKIIDYENFVVQIGQSPMLSAFAEQLAWMVPTIELSVAILLFSKYRTAALIAGYGLMVMFTTYIIIILNFSAFIPCSCGGVLEKMTWNQHLVFNLFFILIAIYAVLIHPTTVTNTTS